MVSRMGEIRYLVWTRFQGTTTPCWSAHFRSPSLGHSFPAGAAELLCPLLWSQPPLARARQCERFAVRGFELLEVCPWLQTKYRAKLLLESFVDICGDLHMQGDRFFVKVIHDSTGTQKRNKKNVKVLLLSWSRRPTPATIKTSLHTSL